MSLGAWVAISGAAVAPGLGKSTRSGIAALLMMSGIRLGYWWDSLGMGGQAVAKRIGKYGQLWSELRGRFDGDRRQDWFLSDGGHFENTAAYALLREECELIVVADCGADPRYAFGDLENLVRKARIDLQADITFLRPLRPDRDLPVVFGSLNELASPDSEACLALARIDYRRGEQTGYMIIVKPNMSNGVPVDLVNFKSDNPLFPQEPTTDQSFSEAQWESYFQLGQTLGRYLDLDPEHLQDMAAFARDYFVNDDGAILVKETDGAMVLKFSSKRLSSRIAATGAVSASISLGAITSIGLAGWQAINAEFSHRADPQQIEPGTLKELTTMFGRLPSVGQPAAPMTTDPLGEMAMALLWVGDKACTAYNIEAFRQSPLMSMIVNRTREACELSASTHPACVSLVEDFSLPKCLQKNPAPPAKRSTGFATTRPRRWSRVTAGHPGVRLLIRVKATWRPPQSRHQHQHQHQQPCLKSQCPSRWRRQKKRSLNRALQLCLRRHRRTRKMFAQARRSICRSMALNCGTLPEPCASHGDVWAPRCRRWRM